MHSNARFASVHRHRQTRTQNTRHSRPLPSRSGGVGRGSSAVRRDGEGCHRRKGASSRSDCVDRRALSYIQRVGAFRKRCSRPPERSSALPILQSWRGTKRGTLGFVACSNTAQSASQEQSISRQLHQHIATAAKVGADSRHKRGQPSSVTTQGTSIAVQTGCSGDSVLGHEEERGDVVAPSLNS
ncbi:hypothetical protein F4777DRAFT_11492 [Nemania sp. FL0916]|nr:hypothetical protein F4777DRAFT_11492 [Nemania sp. FL0916]